MIFTNINTFSVSLALLLLTVGGYFLAKMFFQDKQKKQIILIFCMLLLLIWSLLWPRWAMKSETATAVGSNIAFVIDVSTSMNALDFVEWQISRLQMVKVIISDYIDAYPNNKYALDAFSWEAVKVLPFTTDTWIYETFLSWVGASSISQTWTDIQKALYSTVSHFTEDQGGWLIVLFTDGGDESIWDISELEDILKEKNIQVLIVWIWSKTWNHIPVWTDFFGRVVYKTYQWQKVVTRLNSSELSSLAKEVWKYIEITQQEDRKELYKQIESTAEKISFDINTEHRQNFSIVFVFVATVFWILFLVGILLSKYRKQ